MGTTTDNGAIGADELPDPLIGIKAQGLDWGVRMDRGRRDGLCMGQPSLDQASGLNHVGRIDSLDLRALIGCAGPVILDGGFLPAFA